MIGRSASVRPLHHAKRRGALFHYYMMYLLLSSMLLTTSGMCIHSILKADNVDTRMAAHVKTLLRMEGSLRNDAAAVTAFECGAADVTLTGFATEQQIRWSVKDNVVRRKSIKNGAAAAQDRFVFGRGSTVVFSEEGSRLLVTVREAELPATDSKSVQIIMVIGPVEGGRS